MSEDKTTKVNVKSEDEAKTAPEVDTAKTEAKTDAAQSDRAPQGDPSGNSSDNTQVPTREESLKAAGKASPSSEDGGLTDGTQVLGQEGQSHEDRLDEARRDALNNAKDEQKLNV